MEIENTLFYQTNLGETRSKFERIMQPHIYAYKATIISTGGYCFKD